jgi:DNA repair exonuclease SbcCD ATPase subunit
MWIKELYLENWMVIKEATIQFSPNNKVIGIVGRYDDDQTIGKSNRAGKTTIVEAVKYLLFGRSRIGKRNHQRLINRAAKAAGQGLIVRGTLVGGQGKTLTVARLRGPGGKPSATVEGYPPVSWDEATEIVEKFVGFTHDEFVNTLYFGQGDIHQFMNSGPQAKRELLLEWLKQDRWNDRQVYAKTEAGKCERKIETTEEVIIALPEPEKSVGELEEDLEELDKRKVVVSEELAELKSQVEELENQLDEAIKQERLKDKKQSLKQKIDEYEEGLEQATQNAIEEKQLRDSLDELKTTWESKRDELDGKIGPLTTREIELRPEIRRLRVMLDGLDDANGVCPILQQSCDRLDGSLIEDYDKEFEDRKKESKKIVNEIDVLSEELDRIKRKYKSDKASWNGLIKDLGNTDVSYFENRLSDLDDELDELNSRLIKKHVTPSEVKLKLNPLRDLIDELSNKLGMLNANIESCKRDIKQAIEHKNKKIKLKDALNGLKKEFAAWRYCAYMFSPRGIPGEYIKSAFTSLENDINYILGRLNTGLTVEFKPYRETDKWEKHCLACGEEFKPRGRKCSKCNEDRQKKLVEQLALSITDTMEGSESDFNLDSGGGQTLISFAVRLALLFLKVREGDGDIPPIFLDEIVGMLDPNNRSAIINVVTNILVNEYGVDQIFWISHNEEILDMIDSPLVVTRVGDHSIVDWN